MTTRRKYVRRPGNPIIAVQLNLDTPGLTYRKWGSTQTCKPGDWIVDNQGEVYSVDRESFARTYQAVSPGLYRKTAPVWAERMDTAGTIATKEGVTHYEAGWYLVFNEEDGSDGYAVSEAKFQGLYEPAN